MAIQPKPRAGHDQVQMLVYVDRAVLEVFDEWVGKGNRSSVIRQLMAKYCSARIVASAKERRQP